MSQWGLSPSALDEYCESEIEGWLMAYLRRQQLEARIQATEIGRLLGGTSQQGPARLPVQGTSGQAYRQVSSDEFLARMKG